MIILKGDDTLVSGIGDQLGVRFDQERNDLAAISARLAQDGHDADGLLVLFTTFDDRGAGGPAYFVPLFNEVQGTGMGAIDQRADFGVARYQGIVNMKLRESHDPLEPILAHEIGHRHLAYHPSLRVDSSTRTIELLGRQNAHWRALLHTSGSFLGGYDWLELEPGRFVVRQANTVFSDVDLYTLGLLPKEMVAPFFIILDGRAESGALIPEDALLQPGEVVFGTRVDLSAQDLINTSGQRTPSQAELHLRFVLVTRPDQSIDAPEVLKEAAAIEGIANELFDRWPALTRGFGKICVRLDGCPSPTDAGPNAGMDVGSDMGEPDPEDATEDGCTCIKKNRANRSRDSYKARKSIDPVVLFCVFAFALRPRSKGRGHPREVQREVV